MTILCPLELFVTYLLAFYDTFFPNTNERLSYKSVGLKCYATHFCLRIYNFISFLVLRLPAWFPERFVGFCPHTVFPSSVARQPDILAGLFHFTHCSVKTAHLHLLQITTSHRQHCSAENLRPAPCTSCHYTQHFPAFSGTCHSCVSANASCPLYQYTVPPSGIFDKHSLFILLGTFFYLANTFIHSLLQASLTKHCMHSISQE